MSIKTQILFESMNRVFDELEQIREVLEANDRLMGDLGLADENNSVVSGVEKALEAMEDFLPGLEAVMHDTTNGWPSWTSLEE